MHRIVFLINDFNTRGGTERVASIITSSLAAHGFDVCIIGLNGNPANFYYNLHDSISLHSLDISPTNPALKILRARAAIRKFNKSHKTTTFITVETILTLFAIPALAGTKIRHLVWEHFNFHVDLGLKARTIARHLSLAFADSIVVLTEKDKLLWKKDGWFDAAEVICIPNPTTIPQTDTWERREKKVIAVGRLTYQKGFDLLISAWSQVKPQLNENWTLEIIGDGPDRDKLRQQADNLGLQDSVHLIPATKDVHIYFETASIYCLSSRFEGLPMVLLEALAYKLPIVSFNCETGPEQVVVDGKNGLLAQVEDVDALAKSLLELIRKPELRKQMSENTQTIYEQFRLEKIIPKWVNLLQKEY